MFELEDLVKALKKEKCSDLLVIRVDPQLAYVDHLVVATCRTPRHLRAVAEFVKKLYKLKMDRSAGDVVPKLEGLEGKSEWIAMDLGKIRDSWWLLQC